MKKILSFTLLQMAISTTVMANPLISATMVPTSSIAGAYGCLTTTGEEQQLSCAALATAAPFSVTSLAALIALKEDVQQVEQDAYNYLAGEDISDALKALIDSAKAENAELAQRSDKEIAAVMVQTLKIQ